MEFNEKISLFIIIVMSIGIISAPYVAYGEVFIIEISDGISSGDSEPKTNFVKPEIFKYNLISIIS